jgi:hypothetical protein
VTRPGTVLSIGFALALCANAGAFEKKQPKDVDIAASSSTTALRAQALPQRQAGAHLLGVLPLGWIEAAAVAHNASDIVSSSTG